MISPIGIKIKTGPTKSPHLTYYVQCTKVPAYTSRGWIIYLIIRQSNINFPLRTSFTRCEMISTVRTGFPQVAKGFPMCERIFKVRTGFLKCERVFQGSKGFPMCERVFKAANGFSKVRPGFPRSERIPKGERISNCLPMLLDVGNAVKMLPPKSTAENAT